MSLGSDSFQSKCVHCGKEIYISLDVTIGDVKDDPTIEMCSRCADAERGE